MEIRADFFASQKERLDGHLVVDFRYILSTLQREAI